MRISSNNAICLVVGVLVLSVQCLFFTKSLYTRDIRILQSKVTLLTRETSLLRDRRLSQQKKMSNADKVLLSRLRAVLKNYKVAKQLNIMNDNVAPPTSKKGNTVIRKITETTAAETRSKKIQSSPQAITSEINTTMSWSRSTAKSTTAFQITTKNRSKIVTTKAMPISSGISLKTKSTPAAHNCLEQGVDYIGHDAGAAVSASDPNDCQRQCASSAICLFFTFRHSVGECWLKTKRDASTEHNSDLTSGPAKCSAQAPLATTTAMTALDNTGPRDVDHGRRHTSTGGTTALLLLCYNRPKYLRRSLGAVKQHLPAIPATPDQLSRTNMPFYISQDGNHERVASTIRSFIAANQDWDIVHLRHRQKHVRGDDHLGYRKLARHFGWAFETIFKDQRVSNIVVLEDDLEVAPDFFAYFSALIPVLRADPTLWSVSAWSDNGQQRFVDGGNSAEVLRSDFFPGLGWVLTRELWSEFGGNHASFAPGGYWDDWMREPAQRKGRQVLRPEISRTYTFGEKGVSSGQFFRQHLQAIRLNRDMVDWGHMDLSHLAKHEYDERFRKLVSAAQEISIRDAQNKKFPSSRDVKIIYSQLERGSSSFVSMARSLGIMSDIKAGVPRTGYNGVVTVRIDKMRVFLTPRTFLNRF